MNTPYSSKSSKCKIAIARQGRNKFFPPISNDYLCIFFCIYPSSMPQPLRLCQIPRESPHTLTLTASLNTAPFPYCTVQRFLQIQIQYDTLLCQKIFVITQSDNAFLIHAQTIRTYLNWQRNLQYYVRPFKIMVLPNCVCL